MNDLSTLPIRDAIEHFAADWRSLCRRYPIAESPTQSRRLLNLVVAWQGVFEKAAPTAFSGRDRVDAVVFRNELGKRGKDLERLIAIQEERLAESPFVTRIFALEVGRMDGDPIDPKAAAKEVTEIAEAAGPVATPGLLDAAIATFNTWFDFYNAYDPQFAWWLSKPASDLRSALDAIKSQQTPGKILGRPVGRDGLVADLAYEGIPYSPEELIALGEAEFAWCQEEIVKAATELGFPGDERAAFEHVKDLAVEPGHQPQLVKELADEAIDYVEKNRLLNVPDLAKETWRMTMMSAKDQLVNPFFLGGECIIVSYPTAEMTHAQKLMSMRGNTGHFSRATVQHELIPGHHMQQFMCERFLPYRDAFVTPFWIEGWTLYWEMRLWDLGFARGPEDRLGMLFWRRHRAARVSFSLKFHMGLMSVDECVRMLVDEVGHDLSTAEGEVRRSFQGDYPPLYQAAYLIGGMQVRALWREMVGGGKMTDLEFHDAFLKQNFLPISVLRAVLRGEELTDWSLPIWRFA